MLSYSQTLLLFFSLVSFLFLFAINGRTRVSFFMAIVTLCTFLAVFMHSLDFVISHGKYVIYALLLVTVTIIYKFLHNMSMKLPANIFLTAFFVTIILVLEYSLSLRYGLVEVGEQIPDAAIYMRYGHWSSSLKNPYYDLINVASFWIAFLHEVYGAGDVVNAIPNLVLYITIILLSVCSLLIIYRRFIGAKGGFDVIAYVLLIAIATPYVTFISVPPSLSALYALLFISFFISRAGLDVRDYGILIMLALAGILTHATSVAMITFFLLFLLFVLVAVNRAHESYPWSAFKILVMLLALHTLLSLIRFFYTSAYVSLYPYYSDFMRFFNFFIGTGEVETRMSRYELYSPLFTVFSWILLPAFAMPYVLYFLLHKRSCATYQQLLSLPLLIGGLLLIFIGFIGSFFSNSFSREAGYPGYMLLFLGSVEPIRVIINSKRNEVILLVMVVLSLISGMYTVKNAPELYMGKIPCLAYRPPTSSEIILAEDLLRLSILENMKGFKIYQYFDPGIYLVKIIELRLVGFDNILSLSMNVQPITSLSNMSVSDIIFNSPSLYISR